MNNASDHADRRDDFEPGSLSLLMDAALPLLVKLAILLCVVFLLAPLVAVIGTALNKPPVIAFPPQSWSLESFREIPSYWYDTAIVSLQLAACSTLLAGALTIPAAFALVRGWVPGKSMVEGLLQGPLQVPQIVLAVGLFQFLLLVRTSVNPHLFGSFAGLLIAHTILVAPYMLATIIGRVASMDAAIEEAADGLGAGPARIFFTVILPILRPTLLAAGSLAFVISFDNVTLSLFLSAGTATTTLPVTLFTAIELAASPIVFAAASLTIIFSLAMTALIEKLVGLRAVVVR